MLERGHRVNRSRSIRWSAMTALALAATAASATPTLAAESKTRPATAGTHRRGGQIVPGSKVASPVTADTGRRAYFVQFEGAGAAQLAKRAGGLSRGVAVAQSRRDQVDGLSGTALSVARRVDGRATRLFTVSNAVPGMGVRLDAAGVKALAALPSVVKVTAIVPKTPQNANVASLVKARRHLEVLGQHRPGRPDRRHRHRHRLHPRRLRRRRHRRGLRRGARRLDVVRLARRPARAGQGQGRRRLRLRRRRLRRRRLRRPDRVPADRRTRQPAGLQRPRHARGRAPPPATASSADGTTFTRQLHEPRQPTA